MREFHSVAGQAHLHGPYASMNWIRLKGRFTGRGCAFSASQPRNGGTPLVLKENQARTGGKVNTPSGGLLDSAEPPDSRIR